MSLWFDRGNNTDHQRICFDCLKEENAEYQSVKSKVFTLAFHEKCGHIKEGMGHFKNFISLTTASLFKCLQRKWKPGKSFQ